MDIHKPKPVRSWREFLTEVGTIVLGVSIALAAEQGVEYIHWRNQVTEARKSIASEMALNISTAMIRLRTQDCTERRLDELAKILDTASRTGSLPPIGYIGMPPRSQWTSGSWESILASQAATHFPRQQLATLARAFYGINSARAQSLAEYEDWSDLNAMVGPGRRLDPASEADLRKALGRARTRNIALANIAYQTLVFLKTQNLPYNQSNLDSISAVLNRPLNGSKAAGSAAWAVGSPMPAPNAVAPVAICLPIGAVPPEYGQTPLYDYPSRLEDGIKLLPNLKSPVSE
jgi:hypothetical protein